MTAEHFQNTTSPIPELTVGTEVATAEASATLLSLREYRIDTLYRKSSEGIARQLTQPDFTESTLFADGDWDKAASQGFLQTDSNIATPSGMRILSAIGKSESQPDLYKLARHLKKDEQINLPLGEGVSLMIRKFRDDKQSISCYFAIDPVNEQTSASSTIQSFHERLAQANNDYTTAKSEVANALSQGETEAYSTINFNFTDNIPELTNLLDQSELRVASHYDAPSEKKRGQQTIEKLYALPAHYSGELPATDAHRSQEGIYFDEQGNITKILIADQRPGIYYGLKPMEIKSGDIDELDFQFGVELVIPEMYAELDYNGVWHENAIPFIETPTTAQLIDAFEGADLSLTDSVNDSLAEVGTLKKRYGHGYAELTRTVAKLVNDKARKLDSMFNDADGAARKIAALPTVSDPAAQAVIAMLRDVISRDAHDVYPELVELPTSAARIEIRDGGCKDAEVYIADGTEVTPASDGTPLLLKSTYARPSAITLQPTVLNGVRLPAGALLAIEADGYELMRLTGYSFDQQEASVVFGAQDAENRQNSSYYAQRTGVEQKLNR